MIFCNECVNKYGACCDFCKSYDFNGNGYCNIHSKQKDPEESCNDFHCNREETTICPD